MFTVIIVVRSLRFMCVQSFVLIGFCVGELHGHLCSYHNVWPEAVYCCFTRTALFTENLTCQFRGRYGYLSVHKVSFLNSIWLLREG